MRRLGTIDLRLGLSLLVMGLHYWLIHRPLRLLSQRARQMVQHRFEPLPVSGRGEIAELAEGFNLMGASFPWRWLFCSSANSSSRAPSRPSAMPSSPPTNRAASPA